MHRSTAALLIAAAAVVSASTALAQTDPADRPNIVVILADDLGYGDASPFSDDAAIPTPHLQRLAHEGLRLTDSHSPGAWCTPSRYGLLTGRYPGRQDVMRDDEALIAAETTTLPGWLTSTGYDTAMVGKRHLGFDVDYRDTVEDDGSSNNDPLRLTGGPADRGFNSFYGIPRSLDIPPYYWISDRSAVEPPTRPVAANSPEKPWSRIQGAFWREGLASPSFEFGDATPEIGDRAAAFISRRRTEDGPFFLYVALPSPHTPWVPSPEFVGQSEAGLYGDFVVEVDAVIGRIVDAVDGANLADRTLIWVSSDNGPVWRGKDTKRTGHNAAGPFRGMKGDAYEAGHRVPTVVRFPGRIAMDGSSDALQCHTDLFATIAGMLGETVPKGAAVDSVNQWPVWSQGNAPPERTAMVGEATGRRQWARDGRWKLIPTLGSAGFSKPTTREPEDGEPPGQLYDLSADPGETENLYDRRPDVVARLLRQIEDVRPAQ